MATILRQVGALTELLQRFKQGGVSDIHSLKDVENFYIVCKETRVEVRQKQEILFEKSLQNIAENLEGLQRSYEVNFSKRELELKTERNQIGLWLSEYRRKSNNAFFVISNFLKRRRLESRYHHLVDHFEEEVRSALASDLLEIRSLDREMADKRLNFDHWVDKLTEDRLCYLKKVQQIIEENGTYYAGAKGEQLVVEELKQLPDTYTVVNDYRRNFYPGIYRRETEDFIKSVQVDHVVIGPTGLYLIETKFWKQKSVESYDLRSPVEQLKRTNYAIFCLLNEAIKRGELTSFIERWGLQKISPKNLLLMVGHPIEKDFYFVKVRSLKNANSSIIYGKQVFSADQIKELVDYFNSQHSCSYIGDESF